MPSPGIKLKPSFWGRIHRSVSVLSRHRRGTDALRNRYHTEDDLVIHEVEEADDEDEDEDEADDEDEDDNPLA